MGRGFWLDLGGSTSNQPQVVFPSGELFRVLFRWQIQAEKIIILNQLLSVASRLHSVLRNHNQERSPVGWPPAGWAAVAEALYYS